MIDTNKWLGPIKMYVVGFMFDINDFSVLLVEKRRPEWQYGRFNGPGGKIEAVIEHSEYDHERETGHQAMVREFKEETGIDTTIEDWTCFAEIHGDHDGGWWMYAFKAKGDLSKAEQMTDEPLVQIDYGENLDLEPVVEGLQWLIPMAQINSNRTYSIKQDG